MDKYINKISKENKDVSKKLSTLKKMDKKQDAKLEKCDMEMKKKKK